MITQLEKFVMRIHEITNHSSYKIQPLVEYNGKVKLAFYQKDDQLLFVLNYQFEYNKIIADVDFFFYDLNNTYIEEEMKVILIKILYILFEEGNHQGLSCNPKLISTDTSDYTISLYSNNDFPIWKKMWDKIGFEAITKITKFQTTSGEEYSSVVSVIWKKNRDLDGDLFYFFEGIFNTMDINQLIFQNNSIEIQFRMNTNKNELIISADKQYIFVKDVRTQKDILKCRSLIEFEDWLHHYFFEKKNLNLDISQDIEYIKKMIYRCVGELPHDKLEFFAHNCLNYLKLKYPHESANTYIKDNLEAMEIFHLSNRIVAISYHNLLLCISKTSNLTWMSQKELEFFFIKK